nr:hypothetical protein [Tanacetum cinerariifolium]
MELPDPGDTSQQDRGKLALVEPHITYISELSRTDYDKTIKAIVYRKWTSKTTKTRTPTKFCCILIDKEGTPIQANMGLRLQPSGTSATHYYLNQNIPETRQIKELHGKGKVTKSISLSYPPSNRPTKLPEADIFTISKQRRWYYKKCSACGQKLIEEYPLPKCKDHGPHTTEVFPSTPLPLPPPEPIEAPPESSVVPEMRENPEEYHITEPKQPASPDQTILTQSPMSQTTTPPPLSETNTGTPPYKHPADKDGTNNKAPKASTKKTLFHDEPDTNSSQAQKKKKTKGKDQM